MARKCGLVIYNRPCRENNPRHYSKCDVQRISGYALKKDSRQDIMLSVGLAMGYPVLIDGFALKNDADYAIDLKKALDEYKSIRTPAEIAAVVATGAIGLFRVLVTRVLIWMLTKQTEKLAIALAPAILLSLERHTIIGSPCLTHIRR